MSATASRCAGATRRRDEGARLERKSPRRRARPPARDHLGSRCCDLLYVHPRRSRDHHRPAAISVERDPEVELVRDGRPRARRRPFRRAVPFMSIPQDGRGRGLRPPGASSTNVSGRTRPRPRPPGMDIKGLRVERSTSSARPTSRTSSTSGSRRPRSPPGRCDALDRRRDGHRASRTTRPEMIARGCRALSWAPSVRGAAPSSSPPASRRRNARRGRHRAGGSISVYGETDRRSSRSTRSSFKQDGSVLAGRTPSSTSTTTPFFRRPSSRSSKRFLRTRKPKRKRARSGSASCSSTATSGSSAKAPAS